MNTKIRPIWFLTLAILAALLIAPSYRAGVLTGTNVVKLDSPSAPMAYPINPGFCFPDVDGANDAAGQKDLTSFCLDVTTNSGIIEVQWNWDPTGTSGANTMNALVFFDSDGDGFANYALNVVTNSDPAVYQAAEWYSCPDDDSATQCGGATLLSFPAGISCSITSPVGSDPFATGEDYPNDAVGYCNVPRASLPVTTSSVLNICTIPSDTIDSVRSDCTAFEGGGFISIEKYENPPANPSITWDFLVNNGTANVCLPGPTIDPDGTTGYGAKLCSLQPATYSVVESDYNTNPPYSLVAFSCSSLSNPVGTSNGTNGVTGLVIASGTAISCEFDNATPTAVTISSVDATPALNTVNLDWRSENEVYVLGYNVYRSLDAQSPGVKINSSMIPAQNKGQPIGADYQFADSNPIRGLTNYYRIQVVLQNGTEWSDQVSAFLSGFIKYLPYIKR